jgi:uncharacterized protein (DUF1501 family)
VRFIQLYHRDWDHHDDISHVKMKADEVDRPTAALIRDLKERGMWDDTLIVWGGEFGRTPMAQGKGRDHHIKGFSIVLAGGGGAGRSDSPMARPMNWVRRGGKPGVRA